MEEKKWWKQLQPLRIPPGWACLWNKLESREPAELPEDDPAWLFTLVQDMSYFRREGKEQIIEIDLGWYPDGDPGGAYRLEAILNGDWIHPLMAFTSRSTKEITETLEIWFFEVLPCNGKVDEKQLRKWVQRKYSKYAWQEEDDGKTEP